MSLRGCPRWLLALALLCRLFFFLQLQSSPTYEAPEGGDSILYDKVAAGAPEPARAYFHSPLYQWFLGGVYQVAGRDLTVVRVLQHLGGILMVILVWATARELFGSRKVAAVAGAAAAICGPIIFFEGQLLVDALMPLLAAAVPAAALWHQRRQRTDSAVLLGALVAVAALARGVALVWAPLLVAWLWRGGGRGQRRPRHALAFSAAVAITIAPATIRNYAVEGELVAITANGGLNLYIGNNAQATGAYVLPPGLWFEPGDPSDDYAGYTTATRELGHVPSSSELSGWWSKKALDYMAENPGRIAALAVAKLRILVNDFEYPQLYNYDGYRLVTPFLNYLPTAGWLLLPGLVGMAFSWLRRGRHPCERLSIGLALLYAGSFLPFFVVDRFRAAWLPLLAPFAAFAVVELVVALRDRRWHRSAALAGAAVAAALVVFAPIEGPKPSAQYLAFGEASMDQGDLHQAVAWYERAEAIDPMHPSVLANLGVALGGLGRYAEAEVALHKAAVLWPGSDRVQNDLGLVYVRLGRPDDAERAFRTAIQLNPALGEAYANLGDLLARRGDAARAIDALRSALMLIPRGTAAEAAISARLAGLTSP